MEAPGGSTEVAVNKYTLGSESSYLREIESALDSGGVEAGYAKYMELREEHKESPSYFMYVAQLLHTKKAKPDQLHAVPLGLMVQIVTTPLDMGLQDVQLFRSVAYFLLEAGAMTEALAVLRRVMALSPSEPTSFVDLALASFLQVYRGKLTASPEELRAQVAEAIGFMSQVVTGQWPSRFEEIQVPCLVLLNWMVQWAERYGREKTGQEWDMWPSEALDAAQFQSEMKLDLLVWLGWDTDKTDLDLHVTEPSKAGQHVYYSNRTSVCGYLTKDFTQGYGPEVYMSRRAPPGDYKIQCKYFASHQVSATTGTSSAVVWSIRFMGDPVKEDVAFKTIRLSGQKDMHDVMSITIPGDIEAFKASLG